MRQGACLIYFPRALPSNHHSMKGRHMYVKKVAELDVTIDNEGDWIFINFDKAGTPNGYASIKLESDYFLTTVINKSGDVIDEIVTKYGELNA